VPHPGRLVTELGQVFVEVVRKGVEILRDVLIVGTGRCLIPGHCRQHVTRDGIGGLLAHPLFVELARPLHLAQPVKQLAERFVRFRLTGIELQRP
jgi:hypothetical protein